MNTKLRAAIAGTVIAGAAALTLAAPGIASAGPRYHMKKEPISVSQSAPAQSANTATGVSAR